MMSEPAIAKLVGQGVEKPNADRELPLDLHYQKLIDWMVSLHVRLCDSTSIGTPS